MFPQLPPWNGMHPLIVHFPIALLMVAPLFLLLGLIVRKHRFPFAIAALILMALGTIGVHAAAASGEATEDVVETQGVPHAAIEQHEDLARTTQILFSILTVGFALLLAVPLVMRKGLDGRAPVIVGSILLVTIAAALLQLANTAHSGGVLVHQHGARAWSNTGSAVPATPANTGTTGHPDDHDDD